MTDAEMRDVTMLRLAEAEDILLDAQRVIMSSNSDMIDDVRILNRIERYRRENPCSCTSQGQSGECTTTTS